MATTKQPPKLYHTGDTVQVDGYDAQIFDTHFDDIASEWWYSGIDNINGVPKNFAQSEVGQVISRFVPVEQMDPLPPDITFYERTDPNLWLNLYVEYASKISPMTPKYFHESAGLWLASTAIARRLRLRMYFGDIYPNLFINWIAPTTLFRKTTALDVARNLVREVIPYLIIPSAISPEALIADMAGKEPINLSKLSQPIQDAWKTRRNFAAQRGLIIDELSSLLVLSKKDYGHGIIEALIKFFDCDPNFEQSSKTYGMTVIESTWLSLLGATTPIAMTDYLGRSELWENGFWPRFALLTPENETPIWAEAEATNSLDEMDLKDRLKNLAQQPILDKPTYPNDYPAKPKDVEIDPNAFNLWKSYNKALSYDLLLAPSLDTRLHGIYGRLPVQVLKISIILAALEWDNKPVPRITFDHVANAITIAEKWRASAHRALEMGKENEFGRIEKRIVRQLSKPNHVTMGMSFRDLSRNMRDVKPQELREILEQMIDTGVIVGTSYKPGPNGSRSIVDSYRII